MNNATMTRRRYQGNYSSVAPEVKPEVHPIKAEIAKNIGSFSFTATFEEDREALAAFQNEGLIAYRCILRTPEGRVLGIGHGMNVLSMESRYLSKSVSWARSGALIAAVTNAVKFPDLSGNATPDFGLNGSDLTSTFMATEKQKSYLKELIMSLPEEDERDELLANLDSMTKEDASELIGQLKN
jgi:hypothetical protein